MRLLVSWVRDFVDVSAPATEIADKLGLRGFEVASIEPLAADDAVIDFEVTANRPDCLSVLGFAREIATAFDLPIRLPSVHADSRLQLSDIPRGESTHLKVTVEDEELCPRYAAAVGEISATPSPGWMSARLQAAGIRPIGASVDVTNYVLLELGHPMHAFDLEALAGRHLIIRRARSGEALTTLDGIERKLDQEMLVIADERRPQAVAGVMGGSSSEVSQTTRMVAFESAYFKPASVRRTGKRLGLKTEASFRFERGADINLPVVALQRAAALIQQIGAGRVVAPLVDRYPRPQAYRFLQLRRERLARVLGLQVPDLEVARILRSLGLSVRASGGAWDVEVPTFRVDLVREIDLIEEVGRHYGFDQLESTFPAMDSAAAPPDPAVTRDGLVRHLLTAGGLSEAITFGFIEAKAAETFAPPGGNAELVTIENPLSAKFDTLRPSLLPGLLDAVAHNRRHGRRDIALFEIGSRFTAAGGETRGVALAWTGTATPEHWSGGAREVDLFDVKGLVELVCDSLKTSPRFAPSTRPFLVPGQTADVVLADTIVGVLGRVTPSVIERTGAPEQDRIYVAELDLDHISSDGADDREWVRPLPRHPFVVRDLSVVVADALPAEIISGTIQAVGERAAAPLVGIAFFDRYKGTGVPAGSVSVSVRLTFQAPDRTLTDADVQHAFDAILEALVREHGARQR